MLSISCRVLGLWGLLFGLQWIADSAPWQPGRALGWELQRLRQSRLFLSRGLSFAFRPGAMRTLIVAQIVTSAILCFAPASPVTLPALAILAATVGLLILRAAADGADKMAMVVTCGLFLQFMGLFFRLPLLAFAGCLWVGGQLILCYATSGLAKLVLSDWRNGRVPQITLSSYVYGHRLTDRMMRRSGVAFVIAWAVILLESLFPLAMFAPLPVLAGVLILCFLLHVMIAFVMGLNSYPLAYISGYPSLLLLAKELHQFL